MNVQNVLSAFSCFDEYLNFADINCRIISYDSVQYVNVRDVVTFHTSSTLPRLSTDLGIPFIHLPQRIRFNFSHLS